MEIKGGCLCGAVRYTAEADPTSATAEPHYSYERIVLYRYA